MKIKIINAYQRVKILIPIRISIFDLSNYWSFLSNFSSKGECKIKVTVSIYTNAHYSICVTLDCVSVSMNCLLLVSIY